MWIDRNNIELSMKIYSFVDDFDTFVLFGKYTYFIYLFVEF